jgi:putative transposase
MVWFVVMEIFSTLLEWVRLGRKSEAEKTLEILLLRRQLAIVERTLDQPIRPSRGEKLTLAVLTTKLKAGTGRTAKELGEIIRIVQPETVLKWHRALVRRKWTQQKKNLGGRPRTAREIERLVLRLARENDWGNGKIEGELIKLGYEISDETVANILKRHAAPPSPERRPSLSWRHQMTHYKDQILACDFFTVETLFLKTVYVLIFIELGTRRVHFAGCTTHPTSTWVTQQARQVMWELVDREPRIHFLFRDRDTKFTPTFDTVFRSEGIHIIRTPVRAPNANCYAERWIRSVREECLDKLLILREGHLRRVMRDYIAYYNTARPHQGLDQNIPIPRSLADVHGPIRCRKVLGGIIHDYYREAA